MELLGKMSYFARGTSPDLSPKETVHGDYPDFGDEPSENGTMPLNILGGTHGVRALQQLLPKETSPPITNALVGHKGAWNPLARMHS